MAVGLARLALVVHRGPQDPRVIPALPDQRAILANGDLLGLRAHLDPLEVELEGPLFLGPLVLLGLRVMLAPPDLLGLRAPLDQLAPPESVDRPDRTRLHPN